MQYEVMFALLGTGLGYALTFAVRRFTTKAMLVRASRAAGEISKMLADGEIDDDEKDRIVDAVICAIGHWRNVQTGRVGGGK